MQTVNWRNPHRLSGVKELHPKDMFFACKMEQEKKEKPAGEFWVLPLLHFLMRNNDLRRPGDVTKPIFFILGVFVSRDAICGCECGQCRMAHAGTLSGDVYFSGEIDIEFHSRMDSRISNIRDRFHNFSSQKDPKKPGSHSPCAPLLHLGMMFLQK